MEKRAKITERVLALALFSYIDRIICLVLSFSCYVSRIFLGIPGFTIFLFYKPCMVNTGAAGKV